MRALFLSLLILFIPVHHVFSIEVPYGQAAPDFALMNVNGEDVRLQDFRGRITVLIYWKDDHDYSYKALFDYETFFKRYRNRGVQFIGIAGETDDHEKISDIVKDLEIQFPVLFDPDRAVLGSYGIRVYPTTVLINEKGSLIHAIPGHPVLYNTMLDGYLRYMLGEINEKELTAALSPVKSKVDEAEVMAERNYNLALKFGEMGLIGRGIETAKAALINKPQMAKARTLLGFLYLQSRDADSALIEFKKALNIDPDSFDARAGIGMTCLSQGEISYAIQALTEAAEMNSRSAVVYYELGRAYELKGDQDSALSMFKKSLTTAEKNLFFYQIHSPCR